MHFFNLSGMSLRMTGVYVNKVFECRLDNITIWQKNQLRLIIYAKYKTFLFSNNNYLLANNYWRTISIFIVRTRSQITMPTPAQSITTQPTIKNENIIFQSTHFSPIHRPSQRHTNGVACTAFAKTFVYFKWNEKKKFSPNQTANGNGNSCILCLGL